MLYRKISEKLIENFKDKDNKILVVTGARQIGKSYIIRETAKKYFSNFIEINLKEDFDNNQNFALVKDIESFYLQVSAEFGDSLGDIENTIIFLDEIQTYPHLLTLLKALKKDNRYRYIASGSLLGVTLKHTFIPMGSIEEVKMYPLDFEEFLIARGVGKETFEYLKHCFENVTPVKEHIHSIIMGYFKEYLISGGLPDSVNCLLDTNIQKVRKNQIDTYTYYKDDASKYDQEHSLKIRNIYDYLPSYMQNKVKRVQFKKIENNPEADLVMYQDEFDYLLNSGIALGVKAVANPVFPLMDSMSKNLIKLYYNDVGILSNILFKNNIRPILDLDKGVNLGSIYETVVATELVAHGHDLFYFDSKKVGEVDFLINDYEILSPVAIEVKSGKDQNNFRAIPKLVNGPYCLKKGYIFGNKNISKIDNNLITLPIYLIMFL